MTSGVNGHGRLTPAQLLEALDREDIERYLGALGSMSIANIIHADEKRVPQ